jgi:carboxyl-terminal processing protease
VVLDLRNNPGGLLNQAIRVTDAFLDQGEIVSTRGRRDEDGERFNATAGD